MIVMVTPDSVRVDEPGVLTRLHVASELSADQLDLTLRGSGLGLVGSGGEACLWVDALRRDAVDALGETKDPDWEKNWERMIAYAASKGWTRQDDSVLVAHVERPHGE